MNLQRLKFQFLFALGSLFALLAIRQVTFSFTSQDLPAAGLPTAAAGATVLPSSPTPAGGPLPTPAAAAELPPSEKPASSAPLLSQATVKEKAVIGKVRGPSNAAGAEGLGKARPGGSPLTESGIGEVPPAVDAGTLTPSPGLGSVSLEPEIDKAAEPALAASLRLTESARRKIAADQIDDAMRELTRAISIDPSDAFAYYYLGRAYLQKKNYEQALTFFRRAEIGFSERPEWTAEALSYQGACYEELGRPNDAMQAYQRALSASPNNLMARVGYGRVAPAGGPVQNLDAPPPAEDISVAPPGEQPESAPAEQWALPPPENAPREDIRTTN